MKASLSTGSRPTDVSTSEREVSEVSPADAAAFLATLANLASAIHSTSGPDLSESAIVDGSVIEPSPANVGLQSLEALSESLLSVPAQGAVSPQGAASLNSEAMMPLLFEGTSNDGEYVAPGLLMPSAGTQTPEGPSLNDPGAGIGPEPQPTSSPADDGAAVQSMSAENSLTPSAAQRGLQQSAAQENAAPEGTAARDTAARDTAARDTAARNTAADHATSQAGTSAMYPASVSKAPALTAQLGQTHGEPSSSGNAPPQADAPLQGAADTLAQGPQTQGEQREGQSGGRQNSGGHQSGDQATGFHQMSEATEPDVLEAAALNPEPGVDALESNTAESAESVAITSNPEVSSTTSQSTTDVRTSSPSRLLEHLRASYPAAEVRISEGRAGETLVSMNHPDFGAVELKLQMTTGGIDIGARVDGAIAASLLRRSETSLRKTIHRQGLSLGRLRVERNEKNPSRRPVRGIDLEA